VHVSVNMIISNKIKFLPSNWKRVHVLFWDMTQGDWAQLPYLQKLINTDNYKTIMYCKAQIRYTEKRRFIFKYRIYGDYECGDTVIYRSTEYCDKHKCQQCHENRNYIEHIDSGHHGSSPYCAECKCFGSGCIELGTIPAIESVQTIKNMKQKKRILNTTKTIHYTIYDHVTIDVVLLKIVYVQHVLIQITVLHIRFLSIYVIQFQLYV